MAGRSDAKSHKAIARKPVLDDYERKPQGVNMTNILDGTEDTLSN